MGVKLEHWIKEEVKPYQDKSVGWLSQNHFFRDPARPYFSDESMFLSPADGVILYSEFLDPDESFDIKGASYTLREGLNVEVGPSLVIGIFMTFYDVHVNRVPYPGHLSWKQLDAIESQNHPMLEIEKRLLDELKVPPPGKYLKFNERMRNSVWSNRLRGDYFILQIADYDVDCILPFELMQNQPVSQGARFSQIRYGSQVDLVIPLRDHYHLTPLESAGFHVKGGLDPVAKIEYV